MREILFRGKRLDNGRWVEGAYFPESDQHPATIWEGKYCGIGRYVHAETVGQFTGLTDKNGKKIFEGDLLNGFEYPFYRSEDNVHNYFAEIVWFDENCAFGIVTHKYPTSKVRGISAGNTDYIEEYDFTEWEVIGNIYDNPELLEVQV